MIDFKKYILGYKIDNAAVYDLAISEPEKVLLMSLLADKREELEDKLLRYSIFSVGSKIKEKFLRIIGEEFAEVVVLQELLANCISLR